MNEDQINDRLAEIRQKANYNVATVADINWLLSYLNFYRNNSLFTGDIVFSGVDPSNEKV